MNHGEYDFLAIYSGDSLRMLCRKCGCEVGGLPENAGVIEGYIRFHSVTCSPRNSLVTLRVEKELASVA